MFLALILALSLSDGRAQSLSAFRGHLAEPELAEEGDRAAVVTVVEHGDAAAAVAKASQERMRIRFKGYRVCIFFDNGPDARAAAEAARALFAETYSSTPVEITYKTSPYFTVTVGNCVTAEEAIMLMGRIRGTFPHAFPRSEELTVADLLN